ncbi:hypothetical protein RYZ26_03040 [Terasakiella sp. A23]|uniref:hypothetical protein n=1 Tax=Terasakiella sp. FCG-A23 TaxID=3080561 RepID=UPI00295376E5|nr:hypothetical protein [Terasakiella sp. A23]MDV7338556.1 hypothetical protein [Terasakiella sp. A23]
MKKAFLFTIVFIALFASVSSVIIYMSEEVNKEEGFLYSAIGCISVYKKLDRQDKAEVVLNLVHSFSEKQNIDEIKPGYLTRFIKLVEKKWEKENDVAKKNCDGIYAMAEKEEKPAQYNAVAMSVVDYLAQLHAKKKETATERAHRVLEEQKLNQQ